MLNQLPEMSLPAANALFDCSINTPNVRVKQLQTGRLMIIPFPDQIQNLSLENQNDGTCHLKIFFQGGFSTINISRLFV